jgi:hypothetical protein
MRWRDPRLAAVWWLVAALSPFVPRAVAADWPWHRSAPRDPRMAAIIAAVRTEEARFQDIEYVAQITVRDASRKDPANPSDVTTLAMRRVVLQGDRIFFRHQAFERVGMMKYRVEETSAYDGERTRTVVADNCANIHMSRWQHPGIYPAHSLPLSHHRIDFPLSVYLGGTEAIHAHLNYTPELVDSGFWDIFRKIEVRLEGEEQIDGLRCLKIRVYRWYQPNSQPFTQHLWLARERNYHCIKEEYKFGDQSHAMRVHDLREAAPGVWFPARITTVVRSAQARGQVMTSTETVVEKIDLAPRHQAALFRDVAIPAGLPVFTIKGGKLVGSMLPEPFDDDWGRRQLAELATRVGEQEKRYDDIEVKTRAITKYPRSSTPGQSIRYDELLEERSILKGELAYFAMRQKIDFPAGSQDSGFQINAYDGEWTRFVWGQDPRNPRGLGVILRRGGAKNPGGFPSGISVHRPHTLLRHMWYIGSLGDQLAPKHQDRARLNQMTYRFRYCGAAEVDGHPCIELRGDNAQERFNQNNPLVLYLAADRNNIPIRMEQYGNYGGNRLVPTSIGSCGDFREIAPGRWYPFRLTEFGFDIWALVSRGWIVLNWRRDTTIESVAPAARLSDAVFRDVVAPAEAQVQVQDEAMQHVGRFPQPEAGAPSLSLKRYLTLASQAPLNPWQRQARGQALDALIGKPAPEFPRGATWLNGKPATWESLRGQVVLLGFWAEWNDAGRDDLVRLERLHRDRAEGGPTIIGVHPPGSQPTDIKKASDALRLDFPICIDTPGPGGSDAWGQLSSRFAVKSVPQAAVVNREGKILACGPLEDVLAKTRVLVQKGR